MDKSYTKLFGFFILLIFFCSTVSANDECANAQIITDVENWCSTSGAFNLGGATDSGDGSCEIGNRDRWYSFTALYTDVTIAIIGQVGGGGPTGGTLNDPEIVIYSGNCGALTEIKCDADLTGDNTVESYKGGLTPGTTYYFKVDSRTTIGTTFMICLNNYNAPQAPDSDCPTATVLCDKTGFSVPEVTGSGSNNQEMQDAFCFHFPSPFPTQTLETNSVWYTWEAKTTGTISFDLTPANPADDLDFVVYHMPSGFDPISGNLICNNKIVERCMASGNLPSWTTCFGPTGLDLVSQQHWEYLNCYNNAPTSPVNPTTLIDDNYAKALDQVIGNVYALVVNNFTSTGNGFSIEWGGTGLFLGPEPDFTVAPLNLCTNGQIVITDASFYPVGQLIQWEWDFGVDATPQSSTTQGPHTITYTSGGPKTITLIVTSERYCKVTHQEVVNVIDVSGFIIPINATCTQGGVATVVGSGGIAPYTYQWSNGGTTATITGLQPGTYQVVVTDNTGCSGTESVDILGSGTVLVSANVLSHVTCNGGTNGGASVIYTGGDPPYTILWSNGDATPIITNLGAGTYSVTVNDSNGCSAAQSVIILEPTAIVPVIVNSTPATCAACNGTADLNVTGGTPPYTYQWSDGQTTQDATGLCSGINAVTVTDAVGCTATTSVNIGNNDSFGISGTNSVPVTCPGNCDGSAIVTASGGTTPYTYVWNNGATTPSIANVCAGTYTVTVTDLTGCSAVASVTVGTAPNINATATPTAGTSCPGLSDGSATITVSGGTPGYLYVWDNGVFTPTNTTLSGGTHTFTVTDSNNCSVTGSVVISEAPALNATASSTNVSCFMGNDGSATTTATGGTPPYNYDWSNSGTTPTITGLGQGTYTVTITDDNGCTTVATTTITEPTDIMASLSTVNTLCTACLGSADVTVTGGTSPYTFQWTTGANTEDVTNLCAGSYTVTITDANGCTETLGANITSNNTFGVSAIAVDNHVSCNGACDGSATVSATGGTPPYNYQWGNGQTTPNATGLCAGPLPVTVTDATGCKEVTGVMVTEPPVVTITTNPTGNVSCNGLNDGSATATGGGGVPPYSYEWGNGTMSGTVTNLGAGTHDVTVTDNTGCTATGSVVITEPPVLTLTASPNNGVTCNGDTDGSATATAGGGTPPYNYDWGGGILTPTNNGLGGGTHIVSVTDDNGCTTTASVLISEPPPVTVSVVLDNPASCSGLSDGGATATGAGGTPPYAYLWSNGITIGQNTTLPSGTHTVTVTDNNGCSVVGSINVTDPSALVSSAVQNNPVTCNGGTDGSATVTASGGTAPYTYDWSNGGTTTTITTGAGSYSVVVTDDNGCTSTSQVTIVQPPVLSATAGGSSVLCNGDQTGTLTSTPTGGVAPYSYQWDNGAGTGQNPTNQGAGTYTVVITDTNGCTTTASAVISEPTILTATTTPNSGVTCNGDSDGSATVVAGGGTSPYTYAWDNGESTATANVLVGGNHTVTVTDLNGCEVVASVNIFEPPVVSVQVALDNNASCNGASDGGATATGAGGTPPYTYQWDNGVTTPSNNTLPAGTHSMTLTDFNGCTVVGSINVTDPTAVTATANQVNPVSCNGGTDGSATVTAGGGTPPYTYAWSNSGTTTTINAGAGTYTVVVTDTNGCTATAQATISEPPVLSATAGGSSVLCNGDQTGTLTSTPTGGVAPYTYQWDNGAGTGQNPTNQGAGTYTVVITDTNGCTTTASAVITEPTVVTAATTLVSNVSCNGGNDGSATVIAGGGTSPYTYQWDNNETTVTATGLDQGMHDVTVTDFNNCTIVTSINITEPPILVSSAQGDALDCNGDSDGILALTVSGGTAPYSYAWTNGAPPVQNPNNLPAGTYNVVVTDSNGCTTTASATVTQPTVLSATASASITTCNGSCDGGTSIIATGGTTPYTYLWSDGQITSNAINLCSGSYNVSVTDANGCMVVESITVGQPPVVVSSMAGINDVDCYGNSNGSAAVTAGGGTSPYTYLWDNGEVTPTAISLDEGTHYVTVTDFNGCTTVNSINILEPPLLSVTTNGTNVTCFAAANGTAAATATGGSGAYTYTWSNNATGPTIGPLTPGGYTVTVSDANGCTAVANITLTEPTALSNSLTASPASCNGYADGSSTATTLGGTPPYTYQWDNGETTVVATSLDAGVHYVTITDDNGCQIVSQTVINEPTALTYTDGAAPPLCYNGSDGSATVTPAGGTPPYTITWGNGQSGPTANGLPQGPITVDIVDANGCAINGIQVVVPNHPSELLAATVPTDLLCWNEPTGAVAVGVTGGTPGYSYQWSNNEVTQDINNVHSGTYTVTVTDDNGCTVVVADFVDQPANVNLSLIPGGAICFGQQNGSVTVDTNSVTGGVGPFMYSINGVDYQMSPVFTGLGANTYTIYVSDANGCVDSFSSNVGEPNELTVDAGPDIVVNLGESAEITPTVTPPNVPVTYSWDPAIYLDCTDCLNPWVTPHETTLYEITVVDTVAGCTAVDDILVTVIKDRHVFIPNAFTPNGDGINDGMTVFGDPSVTNIKTFICADRWGEIVFEKFNFEPNDPSLGWNGFFRDQLMNSAVFVYYAEVEFVDGTSAEFKGDFTLIR